MNNDGWIDFFCCDDNDASKLYLNDGAGNLNPSTLVNFAVNPGISYDGDPADSGNYGSAWIDFDNDQDLDLYVAHCRQSTTSPTDLRRINRLFVNDGTNNYTEQAEHLVLIWDGKHGLQVLEISIMMVIWICCLPIMIIQPDF